MTRCPFVSDHALTYYAALPERICAYLRNRGIADAIVAEHLLGWNGSRITIPISNRAGEVVFFKLAKDPQDKSASPKMLTTLGAQAELYGWEWLAQQPEEIIICEGEFDRLVLESSGFAAVTSTGGAGTFRPEWGEAFRAIPKVYLCFDRDEAGHRGAERVARLIPRARIVRLPDEVGEGGDVTDFFVRLGRSRVEFVDLLKAARPVPLGELPENTNVRLPRTSPVRKDKTCRLKTLLPIEDVVRQYLPLQRSGQNLVARCPFHDDRNPSFVVYPSTQSFYCFGCQAHGDLYAFLMCIEHLTFLEALQLCRRLAPKHA